MEMLLKVPVLGAILKVIGSESVIVAVIATATAMYLGAHDYDALILYFVLGIGAMTVGARELSDFRKGLAPYRSEMETIFSNILHSQIPLKIGNKTIMLDIPDDMEPSITKKLIEAIIGVSGEE